MATSFIKKKERRKEEDKGDESVRRNFEEEEMHERNAIRKHAKQNRLKKEKKEKTYVRVVS